MNEENTRRIASKYFDAAQMARLAVVGDTIRIGDFVLRADYDNGELVTERFPDHNEFLTTQSRSQPPRQFVWEVVASIKVSILQDENEIQQTARSGKLYNEDYYTRRGGGGPYIGYPYTYLGEDIGEKFRSFAKELDERFAPKAALDIGCATGILVRELQARGIAAQGIDISEWAVANAVTHGIRQGSILDMPYPDGSFDLVVSQDVMEHMHPDDMSRVLSEQIRIVRSGGVVCHFIPFYEYTSPVQIGCHLTNANRAWWINTFESTPGLSIAQIAPEHDQWDYKNGYLEKYFVLRVSKEH